MCDCDKPYKRVDIINSKLNNIRSTLSLPENNDSLTLSVSNKEEIIRIYYLSQKDTEKGTIRIRNPGYYILKEDLIFHPNPTLLLRQRPIPR